MCYIYTHTYTQRVYSYVRTPAFKLLLKFNDKIVEREETGDISFFAHSKAVNIFRNTRTALNQARRTALPV